VFNGVKEFRIEVTELSISVWANAKRKAGTNVPKHRGHYNILPFMFWNLWQTPDQSTIKKKAANIIRKDYK
jgi:hypothetical protein